MRCPNCNKFTALTFDDAPAWEDDPVVEDGEITGQVRIVRCTEYCGDEAKETTFDVAVDVPPDVVAAHTGDGHELSVEPPDLDPIEEGGGRYAKSYFGAACTFDVMCSCQKKPVACVSWQDKTSASSMDNLLE